MNGFEKWRHAFFEKTGDVPKSRESFVAGLRHAAEISGNEDCDQEEHCCVTVDRIVQSIESEAQKIEKGE